MGSNLPRLNGLLLEQAPAMVGVARAHGCRSQCFEARGRERIDPGHPNAGQRGDHSTRRKHMKIRTCVLGALIAGVVATANAETFLVNKTDDDGSPHTLRWAILQ